MKINCFKNYIFCNYIYFRVLYGIIGYNCMKYWWLVHLPDSVRQVWQKCRDLGYKNDDERFRKNY